jgi:predicted xylose isomerase-like sugar epimerase
MTVMQLVNDHRKAIESMQFEHLALVSERNELAAAHQVRVLLNR